MVPRYGTQSDFCIYPLFYCFFRVPKHGITPARMHLSDALRKMQHRTQKQRISGIVISDFPMDLYLLY